eukprot:1869830-Rhodomonas_salina.1
MQKKKGGKGEKKGEGWRDVELAAELRALALACRHQPCSPRPRPAACKVAAAAAADAAAAHAVDAVEAAGPAEAAGAVEAVEAVDAAVGRSAEVIPAVGRSAE